MVSIHLVKVGGIDPAIPEFLAAVLEEVFPARCRIDESPVNPAPAFDSRRRQYGAAEILGLLAIREPYFRRLSGPGEPVRILGLADVDLFAPVLTYIFGQAQVRGQAAVMSICRLRQEFYGLPPDRLLLLRRCEKEAIHELGHTFGLLHCRRRDCVMYFSNSIEEVDLKPGAFCRECAARLSGAADGH